MAQAAPATATVTAEGEIPNEKANALLISNRTFTIRCLPNPQHCPEECCCWEMKDLLRSYYPPPAAGHCNQFLPGLLPAGTSQTHRAKRIISRITQGDVTHTT